MKTFNQKVYDVVERIPYGMVMNYGQVAVAVGNPRCARMVGYALHASNGNLPWHRVVFKDGSLCGHGEVQYKLLKAEKVSFNKEKKVNMTKHQWDALEIMIELFEC